jgi:hypothetical protein
MLGPLVSARPRPAFASCSFAMIRPSSSGNLDGFTVLINATASHSRLVNDSFWYSTRRHMCSASVRHDGRRQSFRKHARRRDRRGPLTS